MAACARPSRHLAWFLGLFLIICLPALPVQAGDTVTIAVAGPKSGIQAPRFKAILVGVRKALSDHPAARAIHVLTFDDRCQAVAARKIAQEIVAARAQIVIGHPCATATTAVGFIYRNAGVLFFSVGANTPGDAPKSLDQGTFSILRQSERAPAHIARYLATTAASKQIALIHDQTALGRNLTRKIARNLQDHHATAPTIHSIEAAKRTYAKLVSTIIAQEIDVIHFSGFPTEARILIDELEAAGAHLTFLGSETLLTPRFIAFMESHAADHRVPHATVNLAITVPFKAGSTALFKNAGRAHEVIARLNKNSLQADAYAATQVWIKASRRVAQADGPEVTNAIQAGSFATKIGKIKFDEYGVTHKPWSGIALFNGTAWIPAPHSAPLQ